jgi:hypothetical protein
MQNFVCIFYFLENLYIYIYISIYKKFDILGRELLISQGNSDSQSKAS